MSAHFLSAEVAQILESLSMLPGGTTLGVQTKRYPRFLPAESGTGYEERAWRFAADQPVRDLPLPEDAEQIIITWQGAVRLSVERGQIVDFVGAALQRIGACDNWDYDVCRHTPASEPLGNAELQVRIVQRH